MGGVDERRDGPTGEIIYGGCEARLAGRHVEHGTGVGEIVDQGRGRFVDGHGR